MRDSTKWLSFVLGCVSAAAMVVDYVERASRLG